MVAKLKPGLERPVPGWIKGNVDAAFHDRDRSQQLQGWSSGIKGNVDAAFLQWQMEELSQRFEFFLPISVSRNCNKLVHELLVWYPVILRLEES